MHRLARGLDADIRRVYFQMKTGTTIKNSEYDQEIPQSKTADKPMASRGRATQQEDKQSKATHQDDSKTTMNIKYCRNTEQSQNPTSGPQSTSKQQQQSHRPRTDSSQGHRGLNCILLLHCTKLQS